MDDGPDTIVLIHGLWLTPRSWENFRRRYEGLGYRALAPAWPRVRGEVEDIRRDPSALAGLGIQEIADHCEGIVRALDRPPILMGHGLGGLIAQILLDRGLGAAGVAIDSVPPRGVSRMPLTALRASSRVLWNPLNYRRTVPLKFPRFCSTFANGMSLQDARFAYDRYVIPAPGRPVFQAATANLTSRSRAATCVYARNPRRAPLLVIAGSMDRQIPPSISRANYQFYRHSGSITGYKEFPGRSHLICAQIGWQEVADYAITWAEAHTATRRLRMAA